MVKPIRYSSNNQSPSFGITTNARIFLPGLMISFAERNQIGTICLKLFLRNTGIISKFAVETFIKALLNNLLRITQTIP